MLSSLAASSAVASCFARAVDLASCAKAGTEKTIATTTAGNPSASRFIAPSHDGSVRVRFKTHSAPLSARSSDRRFFNGKELSLTFLLRLRRVLPLGVGRVKRG